MSLALQRRPRAVALALAAGLGLLHACRYEPPRAVVHYGLSADTQALDPQTGESAVPPAVQDQIAGSLEMLFGTPAHPRFMRLAAWIDEGRDPNYPQYPIEGEGGGGELADEDLAPLREDNERRFRRELAQIEAGLYEDVEPLDSAPDLAEDWAALLAENPPEKRGAELEAEARDVFVRWYPSLRDSAELYRQHCLHCHGPEGGGNGPTADFVSPRPRDYRKGVFKFTALADKARPRRDDLVRILEEGVTGTAMPSFRRFSKAELHGLADYVRLLSMRGMVEGDLATTYRSDGALPVEYVTEAYERAWNRWQGQEDKVVAVEGGVPPPTPQSIARGRELFNDTKSGNCASCHGEGGRGDGVSAFTVDPETQKKVSAYKDDWGHPIVPRDITYGIFRGGRRPIDIYRRIHAGINGTPMPALGSALPPEDIWALVHYVGTLAENAHPPAGRASGAAARH